MTLLFSTRADVPVMGTLKEFLFKIVFYLIVIGMLFQFFKYINLSTKFKFNNFIVIDQDYQQ
jgi:hypothetical protein